MEKQADPITMGYLIQLAYLYQNKTIEASDEIRMTPPPPIVFMSFSRTIWFCISQSIADIFHPRICSKTDNEVSRRAEEGFIPDWNFLCLCHDVFTSDVFRQTLSAAFIFN